MNASRWSIGGMMVLVVMAALALAAVRSASPIWTDAAYTIMLAALGFSILGALFESGRRRAFWTGFAVFGWGYWLLAFPSATDPFNGFRHRMEPVTPQLLTTTLLDRLINALPPRGPARVGAKVDAQWTSGSYYPATIVEIQGATYRVRWDDGSPDLWVTPAGIRQFGAEFHRPTGHALIALLVGLSGGLAARWIRANREERPDPPGGGPGPAPAGS